MTQRTEQVMMSCSMIPAAPSSPSTMNSALASRVGMAEKEVSTSPACFSVSPACASQIFKMPDSCTAVITAVAETNQVKTEQRQQQTGRCLTLSFHRTNFLSVILVQIHISLWKLQQVQAKRVSHPDASEDACLTACRMNLNLGPRMGNDPQPLCTQQLAATCIPGSKRLETGWVLLPSKHMQRRLLLVCPMS